MYECRVCYEYFENRKDVIAPCKCIGTSHYICIPCFDRQREVGNTNKCQTCNFSYVYGKNKKMEHIISSNKRQDNVDYYFNVILAFIVLVLLIAVLCNNSSISENILNLILLILSIVFPEYCLFFISIGILLSEAKKEKNNADIMLLIFCLCIGFIIFVIYLGDNSPKYDDNDFIQTDF